MTDLRLALRAEILGDIRRLDSSHVSHIPSLTSSPRATLAKEGVSAYGEDGCQYGNDSRSLGYTVAFPRVQWVKGRESSGVGDVAGQVNSYCCTGHSIVHVQGTELNIDISLQAAAPAATVGGIVVSDESEDVTFHASVWDVSVLLGTWTLGAGILF